MIVENFKKKSRIRLNKNKENKNTATRPCAHQGRSTVSQKGKRENGFSVLRLDARRHTTAATAHTAESGRARRRHSRRGSACERHVRKRTICTKGIRWRLFSSCFPSGHEVVFERDEPFFWGRSGATLKKNGEIVAKKRPF